MLGGVAAAVLAVLAIVAFNIWNEDDKPPPSAPATVAAADDATSVNDPDNPATKAIAEIDPARWVNDPDCGIVTSVLNKASGDEIRALAEKGDAKANYLMGCIVEKGLSGYAASDAAAASWYEYAAGAKIPEAMYLMGVYKDLGAVVVDTDEPGTKQIEADPQMATVLYQNARAAGNTEAAKALEQVPEPAATEPQ